MNAPLGQRALSLSAPVEFSVVQAQSSFWDACELAMAVAGLDAKQVYLPLGIDKGQWSRIRDGQAHFPHQRLEAFLDLLGNDIPLQWLAARRGKGLHTLESEQQRLLREKEQRIEELEAKLAWTIDLMTKGRGA